MPRPLRLALVVFGLAAAVYGAASLTGGWLGNPPWWAREGVRIDALSQEEALLGGWISISPSWHPQPASRIYLGPSKPLAYRAWISGAVVAVGLGLVAVGALARRQFVPPTE